MGGLSSTCVEFLPKGPALDISSAVDCSQMHDASDTLIVLVKLRIEYICRKAPDMRALRCVRKALVAFSYESCCRGGTTLRLGGD